MLDHVILGRPSPTFQRVRVLVVVAAALALLSRPGHQLPMPLERLRGLNDRLARFPPWKLLLGFFAAYYVARNAFLLLFLNPPEPLSRMHTPSFFRASYVLTAMDAGFWTASPIRPRVIRSICEVLFTLYFLAAPEEADTKVKKFRAMATVDMMRTSWAKSQNPILHAITALTKPRLGVRRWITIPRPNPPSPSSFEGPLDDTRALLLFAGTEDDLRKADAVVVHYPGGGFVGMPPECHEDYVSVWAKRLGVPILSVDYRKAPEHPYPYASEECFDVYRSVVESNGAVMGLQGWYVTDDIGRRRRRGAVRVAVAGDSAGGNLAVTTTIRVLEYSHHHLPPPSGLVLIYPVLSFDMAAWMPPDDISLVRNASVPSLRGWAGTNGDSAPDSRRSSNASRSMVPTGPNSGSGSSSSLPPATCPNSTPSSAAASPAHRRKRTLSWDGKRLRPMTATSGSSSPRLGKATLPARSGVDLDAMVHSRVLGMPPAPATAGVIYPQEDTDISVPSTPRHNPRTTPTLPASAPGLLSRLATALSLTPTPRPQWMHSVHGTLAMTSRLSYSFDRVLPAEVVRSLALLYLGRAAEKPDFQNDYILNPVIAPDDVLAQFPKTFLICGEKDPFVDDTVIFAERLRKAHRDAHDQWTRLADRRRRELRRERGDPRRASRTPAPASVPKSRPTRADSESEPEDAIPWMIKIKSAPSDAGSDHGSGSGHADDGDYIGSLWPPGTTPPWTDTDLHRHLFARDPDALVHSRVLEGTSHGFVVMSAFLPEAKDIVKLCASWINDCLAEDDLVARHPPFPGYVPVPPDEVYAAEALTAHLVTEMGKAAASRPVETDDPAQAPHAGYYNAHGVPTRVRNDAAGKVLHDSVLREVEKMRAEPDEGDADCEDTGTPVAVAPRPMPTVMSGATLDKLAGLGKMQMMNRRTEEIGFALGEAAERGAAGRGRKA